MLYLYQGCGLIPGNMHQWEKHDLSRPPSVISSLSSLKWMFKVFSGRKLYLDLRVHNLRALTTFCWKNALHLRYWIVTLKILLYERNKTKLIFPSTGREWNLKLYGAQKQYIHRLRQMTTIMLSHIKNI